MGWLAAPINPFFYRPYFAKSITDVNSLKGLIDITKITDNAKIESNRQHIKDKVKSLIQDSKKPGVDMNYIDDHYNDFSNLFRSKDELNSFLKDKMESDKKFLNEGLATKIGLENGISFKEKLSVDYVLWLLYDKKQKKYYHEFRSGSSIYKHKCEGSSYTQSLPKITVTYEIAN